MYLIFKNKDDMEAAYAALYDQISPLGKKEKELAVRVPSAMIESARQILVDLEFEEATSV